MIGVRDRVPGLILAWTPQASTAAQADDVLAEE